MSDTMTRPEPGEAPRDLARIMRECEPDRQALVAELEPLIRNVFAESLSCLETCLPGFREPGSADWKLHQSLRTRILNVGNRQIRELPAILKNYALSQVYQREVVTRQVGMPVAMPPSQARS